MRPDRSAALWRNVARLFTVLLIANVGVAVWFVGWRGEPDPAPVLPDTAAQFSLDLSVVGHVDHELVYAVEQRARPSYRIFSFDPATGATETVFTVPDDAIIHGIALSPDRSTLAVAYSPDFATSGNGLWLLDLDSSDFAQVAGQLDRRYLTDLAWGSNGSSVLATLVDRTGDDEVLSVVRVDLDANSFTTLATDAINPVEVDETVYFLWVDADDARRSIGSLDPDGRVTEMPVGDGSHDLDHLSATDDGQLQVAVLETPDTGLTLGVAAEAHGSHDVPSAWVDIDPIAGQARVRVGVAPIIVYDAVASDDAIVYATKEGLAIATDHRIDLISSRALRLVAG